MKYDCKRCGKSRPWVNKKGQCVDCEMDIAEEREKRRKLKRQEYYQRNREYLQRKQLARYREKTFVSTSL